MRDRLAAEAGEPLPHRRQDLPLSRDHLKRLGDVLAELAIAAPTGCRSEDHHRSRGRLAATARPPACDRR